MIVGTLFIERLLELSLNQNQKFLLAKLAGFEGTASQFVSSAKELPKSTIWHNLRILQKLGLVEFGNSHPIKLNQVLQKLLDKNELTIGVAGGFGPETTAKFFSELIRLARNELKRRPKVIIVNAAVPEDLEKEAISKNPSLLLPFVIDCIKKLNATNVDFVVIPSNTLHLFIDVFRKVADAPVVSLIEETRAELKRRNISRIGLLATSAALNSGMFQREFSKSDIRIIMPTEKEQKIVLGAIKNLLRAGKPNIKDSNRLKLVIKNLKKRGAQIVLLACTDLQFLVSEIKGVEIIDTLEVLTSVAVRLLSKNPLVAQWLERLAVDREAACSKLNEFSFSSNSFDANQAQRTRKEVKNEQS